MKSIVKITLAAIGLYVFFLLWHLPANVVLSQFTLPKNIQVSGIDGTLWQGDAQQVVINGLAVDNLQWQLEVLPLFIAQVHASIEGGNSRDATEISLKAQVTLSSDSVGLTNAQLYIPANIALAQVKLPLPILAQGRFRVSIEDLDYAQKCQQLTGTGHWLNAGVTGTQGPIELGDFDAKLNCQNDDIAIVIQAGNSFGIDATVLIKPDGKYAVNGKFKPDESLPPEVHQAAAFFGRTDAQGFYSIKL